jgi:hypothetical protein
MTVASFNSGGRAEHHHEQTDYGPLTLLSFGAACVLF